MVVALLLAGCDAGVPRQTPSPAPSPSSTSTPTSTPITHIEWEVGGLGEWRGQIFGGLLCHVEVQLPSHRVAATDPDGTTYQPLTADRERELLELAAAVRSEPAAPPSNSCTDRHEKLTVDDHVVEDSCPITQPVAVKLITKLSAFCKAPP